MPRTLRTSYGVADQAQNSGMLGIPIEFLFARAVLSAGGLVTSDCRILQNSPCSRSGAAHGPKGKIVPIQKASRQILARAAVLIGGAEVLASRLDIRAPMLERYLEGDEEIPSSDCYALSTSS
jgi:hypothetical protein